jgi:NAD-dependent histone deacetylase SIR2
MVRNLHSMAQDAEPTEFHQLLATLANEGRLLRLYSQNVDCIETRLEPLKTHVPLGPKGPWPRTIQVHGGLEMMNCSKCSYLQPFEPDMFRGPEPPNCPDCKESDSIRSIAGIRSRGIGKLRPRIVLYNEFHPDADAIGAVTEADIKTRPDAVIVVGTSLKVPGVKRIVREMCQSVRDYRGGISVWLNESDPPSSREYSGLFDLVVRGDCEKVAQFAKLPRWDSESESSEESFVELKKDEYPQGTQLEVQIPAHLPSPSLSPVPPARSVKPRKRATEGDQQDNKPAKKPRVGAKRPKTTATKGTNVANPKKREKKAPPTIKNAFRSAKNATSKTKSSIPKGSKQVIPITVEPDDMLSSSLSPPPSSIPSPPPRSISIPSLLN